MRARRLVLLVLSVLVVACDRGSDSSTLPPPPQPEEIETCEDLAAQMVQLVQEYVDTVGALPVEVLLDPGAPVPQLTPLDARGAALQVRADVLGCADMAVLVRPGLAGLTADGEIAARYLELILERAGVAEGGGP